jgi:hypothetical protein
MIESATLLLIPYVLVTVFCGGYLSLLIRTPVFHSLIAMSMVGASIAASLGIIASQAGEPDGLMLSFSVVAIMTLCTLAGFLLLDRSAENSLQERQE